MIKTVKRFLKESEIKLLMEDIKLYPDLVYIKKELFKKLKLFITSSNIAVQKIVSKLNFQEVESYFNLPTIVKLFLIKQLFEYFHWELIVEFLRKKFTMKRNKRMYYIMNK